MLQSTTASSLRQADNNYRALEICKDHLEDDTDGGMDFDEIDIAHLIATSSPRLKCRALHVPGETCHLGHPNYTRVVHEDMQCMLKFLQVEASRSVVREFLDRSRMQARQSRMKLEAVQKRYIEIGVNIFSLSEVHAHATHVTGIQTGINATKREVAESRHIVRGLLQTPDLLRKQSPYHDRIRQIRGGGYRHSETSHGLNEQKDYANDNLKEAGFAEGDIYNTNNGTWDGTVYKQTLLQSLRRKLGYKLYFDAMRHHATTLHVARLAVLSISARRLSKQYKLCFQALVTEFLIAQHTQSLAELKTTSWLVVKYLRPGMRNLQRNALQQKKCRADLATAQRGLKLAQYEEMYRQMWSFWRTGTHKHAARQLAEYSAVSYSKRIAVYFLQKHRKRQRTMRKFGTALVGHLVEWDLSAPLRGIIVACAVSKWLLKCSKAADTFLYRQRCIYALLALRRCAKRRWRRMRAQVLSLIQDKRQWRPFNQWEGKMLRSRHARRSLTRADMLFCELKSRSKIEIWSGRAVLGRYEERRLRAADCQVWQFAMSGGFRTIRANAVISTCARFAANRAQTFYRFNAYISATDNWTGRTKEVLRLKQLATIASAAERLRALMAGMSAFRRLRAICKRAYALREWARERNLRVSVARAHAAWTLAYVRKSTMRLALEKRMARDAYFRANPLVPQAKHSNGEDAARLEEGLSQLRVDAMTRLGGIANVDAPQLHKYLAAIARSKVVSTTALRELLVQSQALHTNTKVSFTNMQILTALKTPDDSFASAKPKTATTAHSHSHTRTTDIEYDSSRSTSRSHSSRVYARTAASSHSPTPAAEVRHATVRISSENRDSSDSDRPDSDNDATNIVKGDTPWSTRRLYTSRTHSKHSSSDVDDKERVLFSSSFTNLMANANLQNASSLQLYFKRAHGLECARAPTPKSDYLAVGRPNTHVSLHKATLPAQEIEALITPVRARLPCPPSMSSTTRLHELPRRSMSPTAHHVGQSYSAPSNASILASVLPPASSTSHALSQLVGTAAENSTTVSGGLLERSMEIGSNWGGFKRHSFIFGGAEKGEESDEGDNWGDMDEEEWPDYGRSSMSAPLDSAMLLMKAARWALLKLRRHARLILASRCVCVLIRKRRLQDAQKGWKQAYTKFSQALALCHRIWVVKAKRQAVRHFFHFAVTRLRALDTQTQAKLVKLQRATSFRIWRKLYVIHKSERRARRVVRIRTLGRCFQAWEWSRRHVPSIVKFQTKRKRRTLYPCISFWRTKARKLHKLRVVFQIFETSWKQRWTLLYMRSDTARLFECYDGWRAYVLINQTERHASNQMDKAVAFRCASLVSRCYMGWLDFHLACLKVKRNLARRRGAALARHHLMQRVFIITIAEIAAGIRTLFNHAVEYHGTNMLLKSFQGWASLAKAHYVLRPQQYYCKVLLRTAWNSLRLLRRDRLYHEVLIPFQLLRRQRRCMHAWHRIFTRKVNMMEGGNKLMSALLHMQMRAVVQKWPGRDSFKKAEEMRLQLDTRGRAKIVLVDNKPKDSHMAQEAALKVAAQEAKDRSFIQMRQNAPIQRRAALFGFIFSADDPDAVSDLFDLMRAVLYAWGDRAHTDASLRGMERLVKFRHKRAVIEQCLHQWISRCSATSHRVALWISKKFAKQAHRKLTISTTAIATKHLVAQYAKLGLSDMLTLGD